MIFAVHISEKLRGNDTVMAQVENNTREQTLKADLPDAATDAIVEAINTIRPQPPSIIDGKIRRTMR